jgi:hypothetical protein
MQTNFQDRQSALITEAIQTIQQAVRANKKAIFIPSEVHNYGKPKGDNLTLWKQLQPARTYFVTVRYEEVFTSNNDYTLLTDIPADQLFAIADYCLNYNPTTNNAN